MSFGEELRRERELREIGLREVAEATKISLRYLKALEQNEFEDLPGGVFNRGFVRAYAEFIGVDPESMVNAYLLEAQAQSGGKVSDRSLLRRSRPSTADGADATGRPSPGWLRWTLLALALVIVATGLYFLIRWSVATRSSAPARDSVTEPAVMSASNDVRQDDGDE